MNLQVLMVSPFHGNVYVYREKLSDNLTKLVKHHLSLELKKVTDDYMSELHTILKKEHASFVHICKTIDTLEHDSYAFGGMTWPQQTKNALDFLVVDFEHVTDL